MAKALSLAWSSMMPSNSTPRNADYPRALNASEAQTGNAIFLMVSNHKVAFPKLSLGH